MSELQAGRSSGRLDAGEQRRSAVGVDLLIAAVGFCVLVSLPFLFSSKALVDFVIRCAAYSLFATSLRRWRRRKPVRWRSICWSATPG